MIEIRSVLLLGDIHAEHELLASALSFAPRAERVISVGDIVDGTGDPVTQEPGFMLVDFERGEAERWTLLPAPALAERFSL